MILDYVLRDYRDTVGVTSPVQPFNIQIMILIPHSCLHASDARLCENIFSVQQKTSNCDTLLTLVASVLNMQGSRVKVKLSFDMLRHYNFWTVINIVK